MAESEDRDSEFERFLEVAASNERVASLEKTLALLDGALALAERVVQRDGEPIYNLNLMARERVALVHTALNDLHIAMKKREAGHGR